MSLPFLNDKDLANCYTFLSVVPANNSGIQLSLIIFISLKSFSKQYIYSYFKTDFKMDKEDWFVT